jgi:hypothetical protein
VLHVDVAPDITDKALDLQLVARPYEWLGIETPFWLLIVITVAVWFMHRQTPFGRRLTAVGSNETAARLTGIRVDRAVLIAYVLSGLLSGVGGVLLTAQGGNADSTIGISYLFPAMAAVFLGQTAITPGRPNVWGTFFALFLVAVAVDGFTPMGAASWISQVFNGAALLVAVAVSSLMASVRERRAKRLAAAWSQHATDLQDQAQGRPAAEVDASPFHGPDSPRRKREPCARVCRPQRAHREPALCTDRARHRRPRVHRDHRRGRTLEGRLRLPR